ncbi:short-chain dehydrogenase/reductase family 16C member 6-like isoform X2 [Ischnura elegans]|uniref:short-chain dehydrogenase/reductase family 16C member 6-like isoform X2 n=1 Tax=Ischnura elegans TaxID=197161 RepID=UPI001ED8B81F|nr:short-chain dehydrogenase/reductase family 16C member 6-like isoform X2 [Ischnura elegans]
MSLFMSTFCLKRRDEGNFHFTFAIIGERCLGQSINFLKGGSMLLKVYTLCILLLDGMSFVIKFVMLLLNALYQLVIPPVEKSVEGEIVLITGAGHGIGRQLAFKFASLGATVVCWDINPTGNAETVSLINERHGSQEKVSKQSQAGHQNGTYIAPRKAYSYVCDVSKREDVMQVAAKVKAEVGNVTVVINNAGIMPCKPFLSHGQQEVQRLFDINVMAHFWVLEAFLPYMIEHNHGHVVALSSMAGICGLSNLVPYCASKYAVRGMMEAMSEELREEGRGTDIKFTTIFPFIVGTGLVQKPKLRFPTLLGVVSPEDAAGKIVEAMRRNYVEVSIPSILMYMNNFARLFPSKMVHLIKDFVDSGCEAHT